MLLFCFLILVCSTVKAETTSSSNSIKKEVLVTIGESAIMNCRPPATSQQVVWTMGTGGVTMNLNSTSIMGTRMAFTSSNNIPNAILSIANVTTGDRNKYRCSYKIPATGGNNTKGDNNVVTDFQLRVRDPLGPVWPTIGILVEAVV